MNCFTCGTRMKCFDDNGGLGGIPFEFLRCPKCGSYAEVIFNHDRYKERVNWFRDEPKEET